MSILWIWLFVYNKCLFFITNIDIEKIYWGYKGSISNILNSYLHESLILELVMILITLFWILKNLSLYGWFPSEIYPTIFHLLLCYLCVNYSFTHRCHRKLQHILTAAIIWDKILLFKVIDRTVLDKSKQSGNSHKEQKKFNFSFL